MFSIELPQRISRIAACAVVSLLAACASAAGSASSSDAGASQSPAPGRRDRTLITKSELREIPTSNLYDVVQRLHPDWLLKRTSATLGTVTGRTSSTDLDVQVFIGTQRAGNLDILKQLPVDGIESLRYYSASEAQGRFGNGNMNGAIQITMSAK
jgi:hypothetical protein